MALRRSCPRCAGRLIIEGAGNRAPEHIRCLNCGHYVEKALPVVMPGIPQNVNPLCDGAKTRLGPLSRDEKRERNRAAQRKYRAKVGLL